MRRVNAGRAQALADLGDPTVALSHGRWTPPCRGTALRVVHTAHLRRWFWSDPPAGRPHDPASTRASAVNGSVSGAPRRGVCLSHGSLSDLGAFSVRREMPHRERGDCLQYRIITVRVCWWLEISGTRLKLRHKQRMLCPSPCWLWRGAPTTRTACFFWIVWVKV